MADTAAHLVDSVLPEVPVRQWVLTLPYPLRYRCAWDARLTSEVLRAFLRALFADQRRRARIHHGVPRGQCGAVTAIQRFRWVSLDRSFNGFRNTRSGSATYPLRSTSWIFSTSEDRPIRKRS